VGITLDAALVPIADDVRLWHEARGRDPLKAALAAGDDYELLFTSRPAQRKRLASVHRAVGDLAVTRIGTVTKGSSLLIHAEGGDRELPEGYEHFRCVD
jgi:thiamine monophosphate kinase